MTDKILGRNLTGDFHTMMVAMANFRLDEMTDAEIVALCPKDYGDAVTDDHLNLVWDKLYTELERLDDIELLNMYENYLDIIFFKQNDEEQE
jgi:hypothetical protein